MSRELVLFGGVQKVLRVMGLPAAFAAVATVDAVPRPGATTAGAADTVAPYCRIVPKSAVL